MVAVQLLTTEGDGDGDRSPFRSWAVWVSAGGLLLLAPLQLYLLNAMLTSGSVTLSVPLYLSLTVVLVGVGGGLLCNEFKDMPPFNLSMFALSVALVMSGTRFAASFPHRLRSIQPPPLLPDHSRTREDLMHAHACPSSLE